MSLDDYYKKKVKLMYDNSYYDDDSKFPGYSNIVKEAKKEKQEKSEKSFVEKIKKMLSN